MDDCRSKKVNKAGILHRRNIFERASMRQLSFRKCWITFQSLSVLTKPRMAAYRWMNCRLCWLCYKMFICFLTTRNHTFGEKLRKFRFENKWQTLFQFAPLENSRTYRTSTKEGPFSLLERSEQKFVFSLPLKTLCKANPTTPFGFHDHGFFGGKFN